MDESGRALADVLRSRWGLVFPPQRSHALEDAIRRATAAVGAADARALLAAVLDDDAHALRALAAAATVGETYFFRDRVAFDHIREHVLLPAAERRGGAPVRIWSAGCASGEEAWTLAIVARETLGGAPFQVLGTDLSHEHVRRAQRGVYRPWSFRDVDPAVIDRWFRPHAEGLAVDDELRQDVRFQAANLLDPDIAGDVDLIVCRNVLIYFDARAIQVTLEALARSLAPGGCLVLGPVDPDPPAGSDLVPVHGPLHVYGRRGDRHHPAGPPPWGPAPAPPPSRPPPPPTVAAASPRGSRPRPSSFGLPPSRPIPTPAIAGGPSLERARALADAGDAASALRLVDEALSRSPDADGYVLRAALHQAAGRDAEAVVDLGRAVFLVPQHALAHALLGASLMRLGARRRAERALANAAAALGDRSDDAEVRDAIAALGRMTQGRRGAR